MILTTKSVEETKKVGAKLAEKMLSEKKGSIFVSLSGELGAGKSSFARGWIERWCELHNEAVEKSIPSPTFSIARVYGATAPVAHLDLYRVRTLEELLELGFETYLTESHACLIEWLEQVPNARELLPSPLVCVGLSFGSSPNERVITIEERA